jgi:hypothetical protein
MAIAATAKVSSAIASFRRLSSHSLAALNQNVEALIQHDGDDFVRAFLARVRDATGVLTPHVAQKLSPYP